MQKNDWRNITTGYPIPKEHYCDQPYIVITNDGNWLCVMTTSKGHEGQDNQHIVSTISGDQGKTWSELVDIEPPGPPEASWVTPMIVPGGRVYVFYTYNRNNMREVLDSSGEFIKRVDTLGDFVFKYSDDNGKTWSLDSYTIPVRVFEIDRKNSYQGKVQFFWSVCKPIVHKDAAYIGLSKVGNFGVGFMESSEGVVLRSNNLLTEKDPTKIVWETLPDGDIGLKAPNGPVADEHNLVSLGDHRLYCTYRTIEGYNCHAYSQDDGHTWTQPEFATYTPGGRRIKHPRAANFVRKFSNGKYLLWFHNHGKNLIENPREAYQGRNPVWLSGGVDRDGYLYWSQPEIILYDNDPNTKISYPDFVEQDGRIYITETQKTIARVHEIDLSLLEGLWNQSERNEVADKGKVLELSGERCHSDLKVTMPKLTELNSLSGISFELWVRFNDLSDGQVLLDTRMPGGPGMVLKTTQKQTIEILLNDGKTEVSWDCDQGLLQRDKLHHVVATVDIGPKIITFAIDGELCDGREHRQYGFGRFNSDLGNVNGAELLSVAPSLNGTIQLLRIYNRYLRTSEAISHYQAGCNAREG